MNYDYGNIYNNIKRGELNNYQFANKSGEAYTYYRNITFPYVTESFIGDMRDMLKEKSEVLYSSGPSYSGMQVPIYFSQLDWYSGMSVPKFFHGYIENYSYSKISKDYYQMKLNLISQDLFNAEWTEN
jgi:hypothetical protein